MQVQLLLLESTRLVPSFDAMELATAAIGWPLAAMTHWALTESGLVNEFSICNLKLVR